MAHRGRPITSKLPRAEQLREAKRRQRMKDRSDGLMLVQLKLPVATAKRLRAARRGADFLSILDAMLDRTLIRVADYPALTDLAWNTHDALIPARDAFHLYERNWRQVDRRALTQHERQLIDRLVQEFGNGVINA